MITYENCMSGIAVRLEGKKVGEIKRAQEGGFFYLPTGKKTGGDAFAEAPSFASQAFPTIEACKASLEEFIEEQQEPTAQQTYHVRTIRRREADGIAVFDKKLEAYLNDEVSKGYALDRVETDSRLCVVITKAESEEE